MTCSIITKATYCQLTFVNQNFNSILQPLLIHIHEHLLRLSLCHLLRLLLLPLLLIHASHYQLMHEQLVAASAPNAVKHFDEVFGPVAGIPSMFIFMLVYILG
jgi:hypothetical protein